MNIVLIKSLQKAVTTAGTEVPLTSSKVLAHALKIKALPGNAGVVYIGVNGVSSSTGYPLAAGQELDYAQILKFAEDGVAVDLNTVYVDAATNGDAVAAHYLERTRN